MIQLEAKNVEIVKEVEILRQKEKHCQFELANYKGKIGRTMMLIEKFRTEIRKKCRTHSKTEQEVSTFSFENVILIRQFMLNMPYITAI